MTPLLSSGHISTVKIPAPDGRRDFDGWNSNFAAC